MTIPEIIDSGVIDASIAALDAIAPADQTRLETEINDALYWFEAIECGICTDFKIITMRARAMARCLSNIGEIIVAREIANGRTYQEEAE